MKHASEQQLVEHAMGHATEPETLDRHLRGCEGCRLRSAEIENTLKAMTAWLPPDQGTDYGEAVWRRITGRLEPMPTRRSGFLRHKLVWAGGLAALLAGVFLLGRAGSKPALPVPRTVAPAAHSQVLRAVIAAHLDRTQMLLVELAHADTARNVQTVNLASEQAWARELLASNRLYQQGAANAGQATMAHLLVTLEPVLLQIAHSPAQATPLQWRELQSQIAASGILFKVRVADQNLQDEIQTREQDGTL